MAAMGGRENLGLWGNRKSCVMEIMKMVILDGYTLNPGDLGWGAFDGIDAELSVYDRSFGEEVRERAADAEVVLTNKSVLTAEDIEALPKLRYIGVLATGYNVVDVEAARERGIVVTNIPGYSTESVAQLVFALLFGLTRRVEYHARLVAEGAWSESKDFSFHKSPQIELSGLHLGVIGYGAIGRAVVRIGLALGMGALVHTRTEPEALPEGVRLVDGATLLEESDVLSLHCPLTAENERMVDAGFLQRMKGSAFFLNTARGGLVDEAALAEALNEGEIAGAGLDVMEREPPPAGSPLLEAKNCLITPHLAWATLAARERLLGIAVENVQAWMAGNPINRVPGSG